jgi:2-oxoglutarate ferredoxin oxidoreductase subunit beta
MSHSKDVEMAHLLSRVGDKEGMPLPIGVIYDVDKPCYEQEVAVQVAEARKKQGIADIDQMLRAGETWVVPA